MPSDDRRGTLAGRLATTLAVAALVSAFTTTVAAMLLADALIVARVEGSVAAAARVARPRKSSASWYCRSRRKSPHSRA